MKFCYIPLYTVQVSTSKTGSYRYKSSSVFKNKSKCPKFKVQFDIPFFTVKAVVGSGAFTIKSSNGFYIDITPPVLEAEVGVMYIDVLRGAYEPIHYQKSSDTIKIIWKCDDSESGIKVSTVYSVDVMLNETKIICCSDVSCGNVASRKCYVGRKILHLWNSGLPGVLRRCQILTSTPGFIAGRRIHR
jgi:hypothetical protein